jgi:hypothetical protein
MFGAASKVFESLIAAVDLTRKGFVSVPVSSAHSSVCETSISSATESYLLKARLDNETPWAVRAFEAD